MSPAFLDRLRAHEAPSSMLPNEEVERIRKKMDETLKLIMQRALADAFATVPKPIEVTPGPDTYAGVNREPRSPSWSEAVEAYESQPYQFRVYSTKLTIPRGSMVSIISKDEETTWVAPAAAAPSASFKAEDVGRPISDAEPVRSGPVCCSSCHEPNPYADAPFVCYSCRNRH